MKSTRQASTPAPVCHICKNTYPRGEKPTPSGICHKCQLKIGVVILVIMVSTTGMLFFGIL